jgi:antitoxin (DNA-binding transcriptional repressor) of toxin-antitoxin stability system
VKRASITEIKNGLSAAIDRVRQGETILIEARGVPVARLEPVVAPGRSGADGRVARLVRGGVLRPAAGPPPRRLLADALPSPSGRARLSAAVIDERRSGR